MTSLVAFTEEERASAKRLLATKVAQMMGRKLEENDWSHVYCRAKGIPETGWSNLHIDVNYDGLGVEHKMLCLGDGKSLKTYAGTTLMHPSATRSIRIASVDVKPRVAMRDVLEQYNQLIKLRTQAVVDAADGKAADMRTGWLLWERSLTEFLYFEEPMREYDPAQYWAEWHETAPRGSRKGSKNLWVYENQTNKKRFSVTTVAGVKIQPYFDVPAPNDPNLIHLKVQGEEGSDGLVTMWLTPTTARELQALLGNLESGVLSAAIIEASSHVREVDIAELPTYELAEPIKISKDAYSLFTSAWDGVSDEHRAQRFLQTLRVS